jgi:hypothetical protein
MPGPRRSGRGGNIPGRAAEEGAVTRTATIAALASLGLLAVPTGAQDSVSPQDRGVEASASRIQGTAIYERNRPVIGADVLLQAVDDRRHFWVTSTDIRGVFRFDGVPDGLYRLEARRDGLEPYVMDRIEIRFPFRPIVEFQMVPSSDRAAAVASLSDPRQDGARVLLEGSVLTMQGEPLPEVRVRLVHAQAAEDPRQALTGPEGTFSFEGLRSGVWRVEILGAGFLPVRTEVDVRRDATLSAALVAQPAAYEPPPLDIIPPEEPLPPPAP